MLPTVTVTEVAMSYKDRLFYFGFFVIIFESLKFTIKIW